MDTRTANREHGYSCTSNGVAVAQGEWFGLAQLVELLKGI